MPPVLPSHVTTSGSARVKRAQILTPLFPASLLSPSALDVERRIVGPEDEVPWPMGAAWLDYEPMVAAVLGAETARACARTRSVPPSSATRW